MSMTPKAKSALAKTIRGGADGGLRQRLLDDLHNATEGVYRLGVPAEKAGLDEQAAARRARLEAWTAEQMRAEGKRGRAAAEIRREAEKQAAYTWLNRIIILRLMEAADLRGPKVVTGGWSSPGYKDFRELAPALALGDDTEGYAFLLQLIFEDLAGALPGLFGDMGVAALIPMPSSALRHLIESLDHEDLASCWADDMTLGWVYQYWNDPEREALDAKINSGGKIERHEIASKTQMFTERYMVDWLLQNSLNPMWLAMCQAHNWTPEAESSGALAALEARRVEWRKKREAGAVSLTDLMPLHSDMERRWAYYVPQPIPQDAQAPKSVRDLKLIDPAVGSGHFLIIAFELLVALYREEARHRGEAWTDKAIVERILEHNLHGVDLDPRAVQIAAAALWLKAKAVSPEAQPRRLNLVASQLRLAGLPDDDPALVELRREVERETGIPGALTDKIIHALRGADHLGSLLKIDAAVDQAIDAHEASGLRRAAPTQVDLFGGVPEQQEEIAFDAPAARRSLIDGLERFLSQHTSGDDLGLRLRGAQLAAGVRFARMVKEGGYDLVVANPPYQGTSKMVDAKYIQEHYSLGKADLYAAFLLRGLELAREGGVSAMLTMRNWMFIKQYSGLRSHFLDNYDLRALGDFDRGAFEAISGEVVSVIVSIFQRILGKNHSVALCPTPRDNQIRDAQHTHRKRAATLCHIGPYEFEPAALKVVPEWPLVYWWDEQIIRKYKITPLIGDVANARLGVRTSDNMRFLRMPYERLNLMNLESINPLGSENYAWAPYVGGGKGKSWFEPLNTQLNWLNTGLEIKTKLELAYGMSTQSPEFYFKRGVAFSMIGANFSARVHRYPSIFGNKGSSVFPDDLAGAVCAMNSTRAREILQSLNPGIGFEVGDVNRLPLFPIANADDIFAQIEAAFDIHEAHREPSVEFKQPGPSPWRHAQDWAQLAVDRPEGAPLPEYIEKLDEEPPTDHLSYALGLALGRFNANGIADPASDDLSHALPHGICFLDGTLAAHDAGDSLGHPAAQPLHNAWATHGPAIDAKHDLRGWLRLKFFGDIHRQMYENRPIHWPLCSAKRTFVAWVNIHRMDDRTLHVLQADHLNPALTRIEGLLEDLRAARDGENKKAAKAAEKRFGVLQKAKAELMDFIASVAQCADAGPPSKPEREADARYDPDLDDGVMINSAALWPLLQPQWKEPKKWWEELATAKDRKDYDWAHLAMRYWPTRVDAKCKADPSLGVAHGCFWAYHPARAWAWELRLQDEIGPDFRIEEQAYRGDGGDVAHRAAYLRDHAEEALAAVLKEALRRQGRGQEARATPELVLLEPGLWSRHPRACWDLEAQVIEKQEAPFALKAPDEPEARAAFVATHPGAAEARAVKLCELAARQEEG